MSQTQKWGIFFAVTVSCILLLYALSPMLTPFLIAALLAYLGDPLVNKLQKYKIPRTLAASIVFIILLLAVSLLLFLVVPLIEEQIALLIERLPAIFNWFQLSVIPWINSHLKLSLSLNVDTLKKAITDHWQQAGGVAKSLLTTVHDSGLVLLNFIIDIILIPVVTFYLLRDWDTVIEKTQELIPPKILPPLTKLLSECNKVVGAFFRGQLSVMMILAVIYTTGFWLVGLDFALLIGVIIAILSIIPYLGSILGLFIAGTITYVQFHDIKHLIFTVIVFIVGHISENMILTPLLIGDKIGLHPVAVIFAVLAGGQLFGFTGVILALPVAAVIMVVLRHLHHFYVTSDFYAKSKLTIKKP